MCILVDGYLNAQLVSKTQTHVFKSLIWFHDHLLSDSVLCVKNVKSFVKMAQILTICMRQVRFEKSHGNQNFGFDLLASVRVFKNRTEFGFRTSLLLKHWSFHHSLLITMEIKVQNMLKQEKNKRHSSKYLKCFQ